MTFTLETTLGEGLISLQSITDGITFEEISSSLPKNELEQIVTRALKAGRNGAALTEELLLDVVPLKSLIGYVDLAVIWNRVVLDRIAGPCGFWKSGAAASERPHHGGFSRAPAPSRRPGQISEPPVSSHPPASTTSAALSPADAKALDAVRERLRVIGRMPKDDSLPFALLMSIETMYVELKEAASDSERTEAVREAFPNESQIRIAMLALLDLLDPGAKAKDPSIADADVDTLIKLVLAEERRRKENPRITSLPPAPPGAPKARRSLPPPLPRSSGITELDSEVEAEADA
jgi:hypothetical protein